MSGLVRFASYNLLNYGTDLGRADLMTHRRPRL